MQVEALDGCGAAGASSCSCLSSSLRTSSCDLLSHTLPQPDTLQPHAHAHRARLHLSDRKLSLQERWQSAAAPCEPPGLAGRHIYPSLPYSPVTSPHTSPRLPRRPTVESHSVSITDLQVGWRRKAVSVCFHLPGLLLWLRLLNPPLLSCLSLLAAQMLRRSPPGKVSPVGSR